MTKGFIVALVVAAVLAGGVLILRSMKTGTGDNVDYAVLGEDFAQLKSDFNAAKGDARLVFIVGPSCPECLSGLTRMNRALGDLVRETDDLSVFIVHVPALGASEKYVPEAAGLFAGKGIHHYWDPAGNTGRAFQTALKIKAYAWDVWMLYNRDGDWTDVTPPAPDYWEHQLTGFPKENHLEPSRFAKQVKSMLTPDNGQPAS